MNKGIVLPGNVNYVSCVRAPEIWCNCSSCYFSTSISSQHITTHNRAKVKQINPPIAGCCQSFLVIRYSAHVPSDVQTQGNMGQQTPNQNYQSFSKCLSNGNGCP